MKRRKRPQPFVAERPPYTARSRRFRKTTSELAYAFRERCEAMGLSVPLAEVVTIIRGGTDQSPHAALIREWLQGEILLGVEVIDDG